MAACPPRPVAVTVLARAPEAGRAKTRLAPVLGAEGAAGLHEAMALDVLHRLADWAARRSDSGVLLPVLALTGGRRLGERLAVPARRLGLAVERQAAGDLGARIETSLRRRAAEGAAASLVTGSDCPLLPDDLLDAAVDRLARVAAVLVPARDGGFALLGAPPLAPGVLNGVAWGGPRALAETLARLAAHGLEVALVGEAEDVDDVAGLGRLARSLRAAPARAPRTAAWLAAWSAARLDVTEPPGST